MSKIYLNNPTHSAEIAGRVRYDAISFNKMALAYACPIFSHVEHSPKKLEIMARLVTLNSNFGNESFSEGTKKMFFAMSDANFKVGPHSIPGSTVQANTGWRLASDPMKLLIRLNAQCESFCYIMPENFEWVRGIVAEGLRTRVFKEGEGWDAFDDLLRRSKAPIVAEFSGTRSFMDYDVAARLPEFKAPHHGEEIGDDEAFDRLPHSEQWEHCLAGLRHSDPNGWLEISPDRWHGYYYGHYNPPGVSGFEIYDYLLNGVPLYDEESSEDEERVAQALEDAKQYDHLGLARSIISDLNAIHPDAVVEKVYMGDQVIYNRSAPSDTEQSYDDPNDDDLGAA